MSSSSCPFIFTQSIKHSNLCTLNFSLNYQLGLTLFVTSHNSESHLDTSDSTIRYHIQNSDLRSTIPIASMLVDPHHINSRSIPETFQCSDNQILYLMALQAIIFLSHVRLHSDIHIQNLICFGTTVAQKTVPMFDQFQLYASYHHG